MERVIERCAGLDVHKKTVAACVRVRGTQHVRTFGTTATELLVLRDWLFAHEVTHVAMESTGVYWKPSSMCSKTRSPVCCPTRRRSRKSRGGRPT